MSSARIREMLSRAVDPSAVRVEGGLTRPRTWGVYEIDPPRGSPTRRFRFGNHPVRQRELEQEFGAAATRALFGSRLQAVELSRLLNGRGD